MNAVIVLLAIGCFLIGFYWRFKKKKMRMDGEVLECI